MKNYTHIRLIEDLITDITRLYEKTYGKSLPIPVPVIDIAEQIFHLRVDLEKLKGKSRLTSGLVIPEKRWIILNKEMPEARINFTVAHELGHWLIDTKPLDLKDEYELLFYPLHNSDFTVREGIANYFASALLMPKTALANEARKYNKIGNFQLLALSSKFGVSVTAMSIRLEGIKEELSKTQNPLRLNEPSEYIGEQSLGTKPWRFTMISADYSVIDHNLLRKIERLKSQSDNLYIVCSDENIEKVEALLEFNCIDGVMSANSSKKQTIERYLSSDNTVRFVEIKNGLWLDQIRDQSKDPTRTALSFFPRSKNQLVYKQKELLDINRFVESPTKLNYRKDAKDFIEESKSKGKKVVIVTGCFDLITNAHVRFLKRAKSVADILVVGIEDDNRVREFKGKFRPVNTIAQRVELMDAFQFVDFTFVISGSPKIELKRFYSKLHHELKADILAVSENDQHMDDRKEEIEAGGGKLAIVSQIEEGSTTSLLRQFLAETEFSDIVYVSRLKIKDSIMNSDPNWRQLILPLDRKPTA